MKLNLESDPNLVIIDSKVVNEKVVVLKDASRLRYAKKQYPDMAIYVPKEIKVLKKHDQVTIKDLHKIKKMFDGEIVR